MKNETAAEFREREKIYFAAWKRWHSYSKPKVE